MLTKLIVRNFKRFRNVEIELGNPVVFIGPNNSGKTTARRSPISIATGGRVFLEENFSGSPEAEARAGAVVE